MTIRILPFAALLFLAAGCASPEDDDPTDDEATGEEEVTAETEQAGTVCDKSGRCGKVNNDKKSSRSLEVTGDWGSKKSMMVSPGSASTYRDADGYKVPDGCTAKWGYRYGPRWKLGAGWHKINDAQTVYVRLYC
jgi:hypothetical protein